MIRKITAKAQNEDQKVNISVSIETKHLMTYEVTKKIESLKNDLHDLLRKQFNHSEITIS